MNCTVMYDISQELTVTWKKDNKDLRNIGTKEEDRIYLDQNYALTVTWKKDNKDLRNIGTKEEDRIYLDQNYALTIKDLRMDDAGDYTCWARTSTSEDTDNGKLVVLGIPPKLGASSPV